MSLDQTHRAYSEHLRTYYMADGIQPDDETTWPLHWQSRAKEFDRVIAHLETRGITPPADPDLLAAIRRDYASAASGRR